MNQDVVEILAKAKVVDTTGKNYEILSVVVPAKPSTTLGIHWDEKLVGLQDEQEYVICITEVL